MEIQVENNKYIVKENYRDGFDEEKFLERVTDYFYEFDFILGDWAYGKLRLKGFYNSDNKNVSKINDISNYQKYIEDNCAYDCRYFLLEKKK